MAKNLSEISERIASPKKSAAVTIREAIARMKPEMQLAATKHLTPDRLARIALTTIKQNPKLLQCAPESLLAAIMHCAQLGLEPGLLGHAYFVPFKNQTTFIIGYKGLLELARRSGEIVSIAANPVHEHDQFNYEYGTHERLSHVPNLGDRGALKGFYAYAKLKNSGFCFEVMSLDEIERIRSLSKAGNYGPWKDHFAEMGKKTVLRKLCKLLPMQVEAAEHVARDEHQEYNTNSMAVVTDFVTGDIDTEDVQQLASEERPALPDLDSNADDDGVQKDLNI